MLIQHIATLLCTTHPHILNTVPLSLLINRCGFKWAWLPKFPQTEPPLKNPAYAPDYAFSYIELLNYYVRNLAILLLLYFQCLCLGAKSLSCHISFILCKY